MGWSISFSFIDIYPSLYMKLDGGGGRSEPLKWFFFEYIQKKKLRTHF